MLMRGSSPSAVRAVAPGDQAQRPSTIRCRRRSATRVGGAQLDQPRCNSLDAVATRLAPPVRSDKRRWCCSRVRDAHGNGGGRRATNKPKTYGVEDCAGEIVQENRATACATCGGWSMVIPWHGLPLSASTTSNRCDGGVCRIRHAVRPIRMPKQRSV